jgi:hypothetical protein
MYKLLYYSYFASIKKTGKSSLPTRFIVRISNIILPIWFNCIFDKSLSQEIRTEPELIVSLTSSQKIALI